MSKYTTTVLIDVAAVHVVFVGVDVDLTKTPYFGGCFLWYLWWFWWSGPAAGGVEQAIRAHAPAYGPTVPRNADAAAAAATTAAAAVVAVAQAAASVFRSLLGDLRCPPLWAKVRIYGNEYI